VNGKFKIEKLEEKIEQLEHNIGKLRCKNKTFTQTEINCKYIFQEKKLQTISDLIKSLCHEMNQPLQAITGLSDLMNLDSELNSSLKNDIEQIRDQIDKAIFLNEKIVDAAKYIN
jgi:signal transduction histidine kinase